MELQSVCQHTQGMQSLTFRFILEACVGLKTKPFWYCNSFIKSVFIRPDGVMLVKCLSTKSQGMQSLGLWLF